MKKCLSVLFLTLVTGLFAESPPASIMGEGYQYWSQRFKVQNVSPSLCLSDSAHSLASFLKLNSFNTNIASELEKSCIEIVFMAGVLPAISQKMDDDSREFFRANYGMAMYLSGLNPLKEGKFHKTGWWQLSYPVALKYGLRIDNNVDERHDPVLASKAAQQYYHDLMLQFKNEDLAILAFVSSPILAQEAAIALQTGIPLDKKSTKLLNDIKSIKASFNWLLERMPFTVTVENVEELKKLEIERDIEINILLAQLEITRAEFLSYNPMFTGNVVPGDYHRSIILPATDVAKYNKDTIELKSVMYKDEQEVALWEKRERIKNNVPDPRTTQQIAYKVKAGDNLGLISQRFGVRVSDIKNWNNLRTDIIYTGQKLVFYKPTKAKNKAAAKVNTHLKPTAKSKTETVATAKKERPKPATKKKNTEIKADDAIFYKVKNGDTLYGIAKNYPGVSAQNIMAWNNATTNIKIGQVLKIKKSEIRK